MDSTLISNSRSAAAVAAAGAGRFGVGLRRRRFRRAPWSVFVLGVSFWGAAWAADPGIADLERAGDTAFAQRSDGSENDRLQHTRSAVASFEAALRSSPGDLNLRVKLMHALFFEAEYLETDDEARKVGYGRGREVFDEGAAQLATRLGRSSVWAVEVGEVRALCRTEWTTESDIGSFFFWGAMHWGLWAESVGRTTVVRQGVLGKVRHLSELAMDLVPDYERYGPVRILGRLHHLSPKVPLWTRWVSRSRAVELLRRSAELAPDEPLNKTFLAHALWQLEDRSTEALALLRQVVESVPRRERRVEDERAIQGAADLMRRIEDRLQAKRHSWAPGR